MCAHQKRGRKQGMLGPLAGGADSHRKGARYFQMGAGAL